MNNIHKKIFQFKISLLRIEPEIWRRIQVPSDYTFWDLHVAIQDAMGWFDYHLHEFILYPYDESKKIEIGIPGDGDEDVVPGWEVPIDKYFIVDGVKVIYHYDYGDDWYHEIIFEGIKNAEDITYPTCVEGENACPPEDCGGVSGFNDLLKKLKVGKGKEYNEVKYWLEHHVVNYFPYKPNKFDPQKVDFHDPDKRWDIAFGPASDEL